MNVRVKLFALTQDLAGCEEVSLELEKPATIGMLRETLAKELPALAPVLASCAFAVNNEYAGNQRVLEASDEIACLPPVSGG